MCKPSKSSLNELGQYGNWCHSQSAPMQNGQYVKHSQISKEACLLYFFNVWGYWKLRGHCKLSLPRWVPNFVVELFFCLGLPFSICSCQPNCKHAFFCGYERGKSSIAIVSDVETSANNCFLAGISLPHFKQPCSSFSN